MKKILLLLSTTIILIIAFVVYRTLQVPEVPIHYHANFAVFINGRQINFADPNYMHLAPCVANNTKVSFNKLDNVHLHDQVGNVVHIHQAGIVWNDLFTSIHYTLDKETGNVPVSYYLNGKKVEKSVLSKVIGKQDKLLISADAQPAPNELRASEYYAKQAAAIGDTAKEYDNGTKGAEHCGAEGKRAFMTRFQIALQTLFSDIKL